MSPIFIVSALLLVAQAQAGPVPNSGQLNQTSIDEPLIHQGNIDEMGPYEGGDMRLEESQLEDFKSGVLASRYRWPRGHIPLMIDDAFTDSEKDTIYKALGEISSKTCIQFFMRRSSSDYVNIVKGRRGTGCYSAVGRVGRDQELNLEQACVQHGTVVHELVHAIGYYHEQSRPDRDDYVAILQENIQSGKEHNFDKHSSRRVGTFGSPYDYRSLMHYSAYAFSSNNKPTIQPVQSGVRLSDIGQRRGLSESDIQKIQKMYEGVCE